MKYGWFLLLVLTSPMLCTTALGQKICPDPANPCRSQNAKPYELTFAIPNSGLARAEDKSEGFYAIVLKSAKPCSIEETERLSAQELFPRNKVFVSRFECGPEDAVTYHPIDSTKFSVMAVYAGRTRRDASNFLASVRKTGRFADSYIKLMRVVLVHP